MLFSLRQLLSYPKGNKDPTIDDIVHHKGTDASSDNDTEPDNHILAWDQEEGLVDQGDLFRFSKEAFIGSESLGELKTFARTGLGDDSSSEHFLKREKAIAFVKVVKDQVFRLDQNYFIQNSGYNDFSGGYRRFYELIPNDIIEKHVKGIILQFQREYDIPDETVMLIQIQSSIQEVDKSLEHNEDESEEIKKQSVVRRRINREQSVTGQGVHTDGANEAALFCIERTNVDGAKNSFFKDLEGADELVTDRILEEGELVFFRDDQIFHHVSPASQKDTRAEMRRSILLIHSPADHFMTGIRNDANNRGSVVSSIKLRDNQ
mmetsp:Transcript_27736/g.34292  ORF Transcript_27736/g.34292 Transcript_27736/m.34292 type:complete len:320 (-) Transcript_27736:29-988(-)